jgi:hypothetical protein
MKSTRYSFPILIRCEYCRQTFEKYPNIKFYENPSSGATCFMRTDVQSVRNDEAFRNFANAPENKGQKDGSRLTCDTRHFRNHYTNVRKVCRAACGVIVTPTLAGIVGLISLTMFWLCAVLCRHRACDWPFHSPISLTRRPQTRFSNPENGRSWVTLACSDVARGGGGGGGGGGRVVRLPRVAVNEYFKSKHNFLCSTIFKILRKSNNSINNGIF